MDLGMELLKLAQQARQDAPAGAGRSADLEPARQLALGLLAELREQLLLERDEALRTAVEPEARFGRLDPPSGAIEELLADALLERADLQADSRLGNSELVRGLGEAPTLDHRAEGGELLRIHKNTL
jgi:hypothetical protein